MNAVIVADVVQVDKERRRLLKNARRRAAKHHVRFALDRRKGVIGGYRLQVVFPMPGTVPNMTAEQVIRFVEGLIG